MNSRRTIRSIGMAELVRSGFALLRGNLKCAFLKMISFGSFYYHPNLRIFSRVRVSVRNSGCCIMGKSIKIDNDTVIAANGGKMELGNSVGIGKGNIIVCHENIKIGDNTILGPNVLIYDHDHSYSSETGINRTEYVTAPVSIGKNVWIGAGTIILKGTVIGDNCVIGAGCVLKGNFPAGKRIVQKRQTDIF